MSTPLVASRASTSATALPEFRFNLHQSPHWEMEFLRLLRRRGAENWLLHHQPHWLDSQSRPRESLSVNTLRRALEELGEPPTESSSLKRLRDSFLRLYDEKLIYSQAPKIYKAAEGPVPGFRAHEYFFDRRIIHDLLNDEELDDNVINAGLISMAVALMRAPKYSLPDWRFPETLIFDAHFLPTLRQHVEEGTLNETTRNRLFDVYHTPRCWQHINLAFFPFNHSGHWSAYVLYRPLGRREFYLLHLDSLSSSVGLRASGFFQHALEPFLRLCGIPLVSSPDGGHLFPVQVPRQSDSINCGCFVLFYAARLLENLSPAITMGSASLFRPEFWTTLSHARFDADSVRRVFLNWISFDTPINLFGLGV